MKRVKITSTGGVAAPGNVSIVTGEGNPIHGVKGAVVRFDIGEAIRAELRLGIVDIETDAEAIYKLRDPVTGELKVVSKVEFADGSTFEP